MDKEGISCIAVGDMLKKKLRDYTDALAGGASESALAIMEDDIDRIEAVHEKCVAMGDVTDIGSQRSDSSSIVVDEAEGEDGGEDGGEYVVTDEVFDEDGY